MFRLLRPIAMLLLLVFTANVQAWALNLETEATHLGANNALIAQVDVAQHDGAHDCDLASHHCCHAISHLLGQVSGELHLNLPDISGIAPTHGPESVASITPQSIYHPPRTPDLA